MKKPLGIAILSWLHIIGGILTFGACAYFLPKALRQPSVLKGLSERNLSPDLLVAAILLLLTLLLLSGIGLLLQKKWGWHLASFYYMYGLVRNIFALIAVTMTG